MDSAAHQRFALVELAGMAIGIPAACVLRVLPRPGALTTLPRSHDAIDGVFRDGDQVVALADLRKWMASPPAMDAAAPPHVMLLGVDGRTIGLAVDAVRGLVQLPAASISRIHHRDCADGFFHSVGTRDDGALLTLLDAALLIDQVGAWAPGVDASAGAAAAAKTEHGSAMQALVRIGATVLGFPATMVGEILPHVTLQPLELGGGPITGTTDWRGRLTPVLDPARTVLGLAGGRTLTVVLAHGPRTLAFPVDEVLAVRTFGAGQLQDAASAGLDSDVYLGHAAGEDGRRVLLVDGPALLARYAVPGLDGAGAAATSQVRAPVPAHVVYDAGQLCAAPMHALREIVPLPACYQTGAELADGIEGQCTWRGRLLPVIDLRTPDARGDAGTARLMVVHHRERELGLLVRDVVALLPANTGERMRFTMPGGQAMHMITVGAASERKSYRVLDVEALPYLAA
jgi:chemotaxis signal transduction protein